MSIRLEDGKWAVAKAAKKIYSLNRSASVADQQICSQLKLPSKTEVVQVYQYREVCGAGSGTSYRLGTKKCKEWLWNCGTEPPKKNLPKSWKPRYLQHKTVYLAEHLREPVGFKMSAPLAQLCARSTGEQQELSYSISPGLLQELGNNINPKNMQPDDGSSSGGSIANSR